ncbi:MAG: hypothetical protein ACYC4L_13330 [Chloroflexota bacterium]
MNEEGGSVHTRNNAGAQPPRRGVGGTTGGMGSFLLGLLLAGVGAYLIMNQAIVTSGYWHWFGQQTFGLTLLPLLLGIAVLFFDGRSLLGWLLSFLGLAIIFAGILVNLRVYFQPTTLYNTIVMFALFTGGLGLMARALREV